ncbi:MAG: histidine--tRNA ligase [bacterium]|nr:histidine--tRNA ligase [bacterium]
MPFKKNVPAKTKKQEPKPVKEKIKPVAPRPAKGTSTFQLLRGMKDILPVDAPYWKLLRDTAEKLADHFGYQAIETPILEPRDLFVRGVGKQTDIVEKEMYAFVDAGGDNVVLRPEGTASVVRAYIEHGMLNLPQPIKLFYQGPMFRHDRPQQGRYRQFHQVCCEALGDQHPVIDAELISLCYSFFQELGLPVVIKLNSLGCPACREIYRNELVNYYRSKRSLLCSNCKERLNRNPLRLLDCKEPGCEMVKESAPQMLDKLDEACHNHFFKVIEYLDDLGLPYSINPYIVRGLDYYNRTVFEIFPDKSGQVKNVEEVKGDDKSLPDPPFAKGREPLSLKKGIEGDLPAQSALAGGGRYDGLAELLGGRPTPGVGFAIGLERVVTFMKETGVVPPPLPAPKVFIAQLGESARRKSLALYHKLRGKVRVAASFSKDGLKPQLEIANRLGVRYTLIIGQKEVLDETVIIRDMEAGIQEVTAYDKVAGEMERRLNN